MKLNKKIAAVIKKFGLGLILMAVPTCLILAYFVYSQFRIDVPSMHLAVLIKKTGIDLNNEEEVAPTNKHKGLQTQVLTEGRYFYNPYFWDWAVYPMVEIPEGKMGIRVRLYGDSLPYATFVATKDNEKGIVQEVLRPGRYAINALVKDHEKIVFPRNEKDFVEIIELHDPVTIPAGFKGIVTNLAGPIPEDPNTLLVSSGQRGAQKDTLGPGTYYMNPYMYDIIALDCRSQRFNLADSNDMGFPSKDGFWVSLDGIIEFRVQPDKAAEVYVLYNEPGEKAEASVDREIIQKIIMPNARSFCRIQGSNSSGRDFIGGETRSKFQTNFQNAMRKSCESHGIEIVQALITRINPPQAIATPVRSREVAHQQLKQYKEQKLQQEQEALLAIEKGLIGQKKSLVEADQKVIEKITKAKEEQQVAITKAEETLEVAKRDLSAATDKSIAIMSRKKAEASIIEFKNQAESSGWKQAVASMGSGEEYARFILYQKLAPSFKSIMANTANSPLMEIFKGFEKPKVKE